MNPNAEYSLWIINYCSFHHSRKYTKRDLFFTQLCGNFIKHYQSFFYEWLYVFSIILQRPEPISSNILINTILLRSVLIKLCYYSSSQSRKRRMVCCYAHYVKLYLYFYDRFPSKVCCNKIWACFYIRF